MSQDLLAVIPPVIGHRGAAALAPENTAAGFRAARERGCRWVEFDVRLSADGRLILLHDDTVDRTTDGSGVAAAMDLAALAALDAGSWFDPRFAGEPIPTLEETIDLLAELNMGANIEIKPHAGAEAATAEAICALVLDQWPASLPPPILSSFAETALLAAKAAAPGLARGWLTDTLGADWRARATEFGAATIHCEHSRLAAPRAAEVRAAGYPLLCYTVNHAGRARELFDWGVNAVFSDVPDRVALAL